MSTKILAPAEAKTLYDSLVAANNISTHAFLVSFIQSHPTVVRHVQFTFAESFQHPNISIALTTDDDDAPVIESYANQDDFARAYSLTE